MPTGFGNICCIPNARGWRSAQIHSEKIDWHGHPNGSLALNILVSMTLLHSQVEHTHDQTHDQ